MQHIIISVFWRLAVPAVSIPVLQLNAASNQRGDPEVGPLAHFDDPECQCSPLPIPTSPPPRPVILKTTTGPPGEIEVISTDIALANEVRNDPDGLAKKLAAAAKIPEWRVHVYQKSWKAGEGVHQPSSGQPLVGPPPTGPTNLWYPGAASLLAKKHIFRGSSESQVQRKCNCSRAEGRKRMTVAAYETMTGAQSLFTTPAPHIAITVADWEKILASRKENPNLPAPPSYEVQMLTRDECLVTQLRVKPQVFQEYIAKFLGLPVSQLVIVPPLLSTDTSPPTTPAAPVATAAPGAPTTPPPPTTTAAPAPGPGPAPAPGPALAAGKPGTNRPWVAWWMIKILPPNASLPIPKLLSAVNNPKGGLTRILPLTFARMPNMAHPFIENHGTFAILPPPVDQSLALGYNPGGFRSGKTGEPLGPLQMLNDPEEMALKSLDDSLQTTGMIDELEHRVENASQMHYKTLSFQPYKAPQIIPPMVVSDGPDGVHTESPYGPWPWGEHPYAGKYNKADMKEPSELIPNPVSVAMAGSLEKHIANTMATPLPPGNYWVPEAKHASPQDFWGDDKKTFLQRSRTRSSPAAPA